MPRAVYHKGVGGPGLSRYLAEANREVEVWLQVETKACFESLDDVLSVPGITSAFLGELHSLTGDERDGELHCHTQVLPALCAYVLCIQSLRPSTQIHTHAHAHTLQDPVISASHTGCTSSTAMMWEP